jgi:hypothetical protein
MAPWIAAGPRVAPGAASERPGGVGPPRPPFAMHGIAEGAERVTEPGREWGTPATGPAAKRSLRSGPQYVERHYASARFARRIPHFRSSATRSSEGPSA